MHAKEAKIDPVSSTAHTIAIVVFDGLAMFEFAVACEVFSTAYPRGSGVGWYRLLICGSGPVTLDNGVRMEVPDPLAQLSCADTVLVPPCDDHRRGSPSSVPIGWLFTSVRSSHWGCLITSIRLASAWSVCPPATRRSMSA